MLVKFMGAPCLMLFNRSGLIFSDKLVVFSIRRIMVRYLFHIAMM